MYRLQASVGQGGQNNHDDVAVVQKLLNKNRHLTGAAEVPEDGNLDEATQAAIIAFQKQVVGLSTPDGRVDPRGRTWRILTGEQPQAATVHLVQLTATADGGFWLYEKPDRVWGTPTTIASVKKLAASLNRQGITIGVGDISFANGGPMPPHASHDRGVDVDIVPQRDDDKQAGVTWMDPHYNRARTQLVVDEAHKDDNLEFIFFNDKNIKGVRPWPGHDNHLHLRFKE